MGLESVVFIQQLRTPTSEVWIADESRTRKEMVAQIDIHYPSGGVDVTVALMRPLGEAQLADFLNLVDDELISVGEVEKGNLRFRVIQGGVNTAEMFQPPRKAEEGSLDLLGGFGNG